MPTTPLFRSNRSHSMRLPKDVAFPAGIKRVAILRDGNRRIVVPADSLWDDFFDTTGIDLPPRDQPEPQARESL